MSQPSLLALLDNKAKDNSPSKSDDDIISIFSKYSSNTNKKIEPNEILEPNQMSLAFEKESIKENDLISSELMKKKSMSQHFFLTLLDDKHKDDGIFDGNDSNSSLDEKEEFQRSTKQSYKAQPLGNHKETHLIAKNKCSHNQNIEIDTMNDDNSSLSFDSNIHNTDLISEFSRLNNSSNGSSSISSSSDCSFETNSSYQSS